MTLRCHAHQGVEFFPLCDRISQRNQKEFEKNLTCLSGAHMGSNHAKNGGRKSRDTLPLSAVRQGFFNFLNSTIQ